MNSHTSRNLKNQPTKVGYAVKLFYVNIVIGIIRAALTVMRHIDVRTPDVFIYTKIAIYVLSAIWIYHLGHGKNWARWLALTILIGAIPLVIIPGFDSASHNPIDSGFILIQVILYITALAFVFHKDSADWFRPGQGN